MKKLVVLFTAIALVCFAVPAMAVDWNFYGSARMATFWTSNDFDESALRQGSAVASEDSELEWELQGNSRIGAKVKHEAVSGRVELATSDDGGGGIGRYPTYLRYLEFRCRQSESRKRLHPDCHVHFRTGLRR